MLLHQELRMGGHLSPRAGVHPLGCWIFWQPAPELSSRGLGAGGQFRMNEKYLVTMAWGERVIGKRLPGKRRKRWIVPKKMVNMWTFALPRTDTDGGCLHDNPT